MTGTQPLSERLRVAARRCGQVVGVGLPLMFLAVFFAGPMIWMILTSLSSHVVGRPPQLTFTLENFARYLGDAFYLENSLWLTVKLAALSTLIALLIGYPVAYFIAEQPTRRRAGLLILVVVTLWVNVVVRVFGWGVILMDSGVINSLLIGLGLIARPIKLMFSELGVLIGLTQIAIPFIVLPLVGVLSGIDPALREAAYSVGANRWKTFVKVTLPLSMPGVVAGTLIVFTLNASAFAIPAMMGGGRVRMMGLMAYEQAATLGNFPFAAAIAVSLFTLSLLCIVAYLGFLSRALGVGR